MRPLAAVRLSLQNIPIDLQSLKVIDVHQFLRSARQHLFPALGALASMSKISDRIFWAWLHRVWADWKSARMIVKAETVVAGRRKGVRLF